MERVDVLLHQILFLQKQNIHLEGADLIGNWNSSAIFNSHNKSETN